MSTADLEQTLRNLTSVGKLVKDRGYRQVWRFEHEGRAFYLKFYPREGSRDRFRRLFRGSPAMAEFLKLQWLQNAAIPAPRPVAVLIGLRVGDRSGDAVILDAIEPSVQLDVYLHERELAGEPVPQRLKIAEQIRQILRTLAKSRLGHEDLHLGNFLLYDGRVFLLDAYAVRKGGLTLRHLLYLGHSAARFATLTDLLRGWNEIGPGGRLPATNPVGTQVARAFIRRRIWDENRYFGLLNHDDWTGSYFKQDKFPRRWSAASRLQVASDDWNRELPRLLDLLETDALPVLKRSRSGDVLSASVTLGGVPVEVIIKRPRRRYWYRYINEIGRGSRRRRAWAKAWKMIVRNVPTAWPLLYAEKKQLGYVTDALAIFERVPGSTLARADLDALPPARREMLFRRIGRLLRKIERLGFSHFDAKASNWMVLNDEKLGPVPIMIDIDGVRERSWPALGIRRLLESMREFDRYTPTDSLSLCRGYAPTAKISGES